MAGLNDNELDAILRSPRPPGMVSMLNPLEVYVPKRWLQHACRRSLHHMQQRLLSENPTTAQRYAAQVGIQQRIDLLAWLHNHPEDHVYISMYPTDLDGTDDLEINPNWFNS